MGKRATIIEMEEISPYSHKDGRGQKPTTRPLKIKSFLHDLFIYHLFCQKCVSLWHSNVVFNNSCL